MRLSTATLKKCFLNSANKKEYNNTLFSLIAPKYNWSTRILSLGCDQAWKKKLISRLPKFNKPICLDIACGTGDITFKLAQKYPLSQIYGLDITPAMIKEAIKINKFFNIQFVRKDMSETNFENNMFDIITASYALRNASDLQKTLAEMHRILKPNGVFAILDFSKFDTKFLQKIQYYLLLYWGYLWGTILHKNHTTYGYIAESLKHYPSKSELGVILQNFGFTITYKKSFFFGMMQLLVMKKYS